MVVEELKIPLVYSLNLIRVTNRMRFSARYQNGSQDQNLILEDAPRPTRIGYIKGILGSFVGDKSSYRGHSNRSEPLDTTETHEKFIALIRDESDPWD